MPSIELNDIHKTFPDGTKALRGVSLNIEKGEFVAIMGPSGSGKSTLLTIMGFLDHLSSGTYVFDGKDISSISEDERARIRNKKLGFIFQSFNLLARTSVLQNVLLPLVYSTMPSGEWSKRAEEVISLVHMDHRRDHDVTKLSGGEKQRVAIARALVNHPEVIFADEPTGNLDSKSGKIVMETIEKLNEEKGQTVVLVTHETYAAEYAERIIRLKDGMIESDEKVKHRRKKGYAK